MINAVLRFSGAAQSLLILIRTFCASAIAPLSSAWRVFFSIHPAHKHCHLLPPLSLQMLQHNQKFPLFFPSCIFSRFPCVRSRERKLKVIRSLLFLYPLFVLVSVVFLLDTFFRISFLSVLMLISGGGRQINFWLFLD